MTRKRILVYAPLHEKAREYLAGLEYDVDFIDDRDGDRVFDELSRSDGAVASNLHFVDDDVLDRCPKLRVIGRVGVGYDNIDVDAATRHGVRVVNTPLPIIEPVAEHTVALMLALVRGIAAGDRTVRAGKFREPEDTPTYELRGKTLGLVGFGNTGKRVAEIARFGLGMDIVYHDVVAAESEETRLGARRLELEDLLRASDVVSIHVSLNPSTRGLFTEKLFRLMKPRAYFLNVSRGGVVDEPALVRALQERWIEGAGLDVFAEEPTAKDHPLWALDNVVVTPHRAGWSDEGRVGCSMVVKDVVRVLRGEEPESPVNDLATPPTDA